MSKAGPSGNIRLFPLRFVFEVMPELTGEGGDGAQPEEQETGNDRQQAGRRGT